LLSLLQLVARRTSSFFPYFINIWQRETWFVLHFVCFSFAIFKKEWTQSLPMLLFYWHDMFFYCKLIFVMKHDMLFWIPTQTLQIQWMALW
jgi:hypothetical protein